MPLVEIELIGGASAEPAPNLARAFADALGAIFRSAPAQTWVRVRALPATSYAENGVDAPPGAQAVFVAITKRTLPDSAALEREAAEVAAAVGRICARPPERVHVIYEPPAAGRVAFGGRLVRE